MGQDASRGTPPTRGVPITLDRKRFIRFSLQTRREMREAFAKSGRADLTVEQVTEEIAEDLLLETLVWGLKEDDQSITIEQVRQIVDLESLDDVEAALNKALGRKKVDPPRPAAT